MFLSTEIFSKLNENEKAQKNQNYCKLFLRPWVTGVSILS